MRSAERQVLRRAEPAELAEVMIEVRLIEVAARQRDVGPIHIILALNRRDDILKTPDAAEQFGRHTDLIAKQLDKTPLAEADTIRHLGAGA